MRVSASFRQQVSAIQRARDQLCEAWGREPTLQELADALSALAWEVEARGRRMEATRVVVKVLRKPRKRIYPI